MSSKSVQLGFTMVYAYVKLSNSVNLQDVNVFLEDFFCKILNKTYSVNLVNLNTCDDQNFPGVDLGDEDSKLAIQVTSTDTRDKIIKTIGRFETHCLHDKFHQLRVLIIAVQRPNFKPFNTNGKYNFDKDKDILTLNDLYKEITGKGDFVVNEIKTLINASLEPVNKFLKENNQTVEAVIFKDLFQALSQTPVGASESQSAVEEDNSDLNVKKQRFQAYWDFIKETYREIFDSRRETMYELIQSGFAEEAQIKVKEYLKLESRKALLATSGDPVKAVENLTKKMIEDFQINFVSETEIQYFLYYQLYQCYVFPNPSNVNKI
ncbi:MAG: SMEK domain-containing protein [Pedobacter sp.]|jgi:hypothetical protein